MKRWKAYREAGITISRESIDPLLEVCLEVAKRKLSDLGLEPEMPKKKREKPSEYDENLSKIEKAIQDQILKSFQEDASPKEAAMRALRACSEDVLEMVDILLKCIDDGNYSKAEIGIYWDKLLRLLRDGGIDPREVIEPSKLEKVKRYLERESKDDGSHRGV